MAKHYRLNGKKQGQLRSTHDGPFAWQDKVMLRKIREQCEDPASALGVYHALTVAASDTGSDAFQTTHSWLAALSGLSERTVRRRLQDLQRIGAVQISTPALKAPCTYRLLPSGNGCRTIGHGGRTIGHGEGTSVAGIRRKEERKKGVSLRSTGLSAAERVLSVSQKAAFTEQILKIAGELDLREEAVESFLVQRDRDGWLPHGKRIRDLRACLVAFCEKLQADREDDR